MVEVQVEDGQYGADPGWRGKLRVLSLDELAAFEFPETAWLVEELIPAGALALLVGRPKVGKSLLAIDLLASVASGEPFLGCATAPGKALYVPAEDALELVRERLFLRLGEERDVPLAVMPADGSLDQVVRLDSTDSFARLAATVAVMRPGLVVLDPFRELHHQPENEADAMAGLLRPLRQLAHQTACAVLLIHHRNKYASDASLATRGSSAIAGSVDLTITLDAAEGDDDPLLALRIEGRYGPRKLIGARLRDGLRWKRVDLTGEGLSDQTASRRLLGHLRNSDAPLTAAELTSAIALPAATVRNALTELAQDGKVLRTGIGTKSEPYRYRAVQARAATPAARQASLADE